MGQSKKCMDKRSRLEMKGREERTEDRSGAETEGMCFSSSPSGVAFHWRYPEGHPHLVFKGAHTPRGHHGSTIAKILTNYSKT